MNAKSFHLSVQGASHIRKNKECQDFSSSYQDEICTIAIVCDGHGGDDYFRSAVGSKIGCGVAEKNIKNFFHGIDKDTFFSAPEKHLKNLEASIINGWNESIYTYHSTHPFQEEELTGVSDKARKKYTEDGRIESAYGTTMIAVAMSKDYWFGIHIGDGKCVAVNPEGEFKQPIPWDPKCFLNATTSICDSDAIERFRHFYSEKLPAAVFVGSDGIDDCFKNNEQLHNLYKTVLYSFATTDFEEAYTGLEDYLPRLSAKGSGDDVSVAALLDLDLIPELSIVKEFDREKEKARVEENARLEAEKNEAEKRRVEEEHARFQQQNNAKSKKPIQGNPPKFCENCGERIRPGVKFCSNCGSKISYTDALAKPTPKTPGIQVIKVAPFSAEPDCDNNEHPEEQVEIKAVTAQEDVELEVKDEVAEATDVMVADLSDTEVENKEEEIENSDLSDDVSSDENDEVSGSDDDSNDETIEENEGNNVTDQQEVVDEEADDEVVISAVESDSQEVAEQEDESESEKTLKQETDI